MSARLIPLLILAIASVSCDKVKNLTASARSALEQKIKPTSGATRATPADPALQKLVDQTADGAVFRKDLPFPSHIKVQTTVRHEMVGRLAQKSAFGKQAAVRNGTRTSVAQLELAKRQLQYTREKSTLSLPALAPKDGKKTDPDARIEEVTPAIPTANFHKSDKVWQADASNDFRSTVLAKHLCPVIEQLLLENALAPRPLWFAKRRLKIGDQLVVAGSSLPMLLTGAAKGSFTLKLESFDQVEGHPCGVFAVTGDYSRKHFPDFDGNFIDEDITIQSGKFWLSLIYPLVLKQEAEIIQTQKSSGQGGILEHGQGSVKVSVTHAWKRLD